MNAQRLADAITCRRIGHAKKLLDKYPIKKLSPRRKGDAQWLYLAAQWIDFDPFYLQCVQGFLVPFRKASPGSLDVLSATLMRIADGVVQMHQEKYDDAIRLLNQALHIADYHDIHKVKPNASYHLARCYWKKGSYHEALIHTLAAREHLNKSEDACLSVAVVDMVEAWLHFLLGDLELALKALNEAETLLKSTDDYINLGNIESFKGRIARRNGDLDGAITHYSKAIEMNARYTALFGNLEHRNTARALENLGWVLCLRARIEAEKPVKGRAQQEARTLIVDGLHADAHEHLNRAQSIYESAPTAQHRGLGKVHNNRALLFADAGDEPAAKRESETAYEFGKAKNDNIVMSDALLIQSRIAMEGRNATEALNLANRALDQHARKTDNLRLQARAHILRGQVLLEPPLTHYEQAHSCLKEAERLLGNEEGGRKNDYLRMNLESLKRDLTHCNFNDTIIHSLTRGELLTGRTGDRSCSLDETIKDLRQIIIQYVHGDPDLGNSVDQATARMLGIARKSVRDAVRGGT